MALATTAGDSLPPVSSSTGARSEGISAIMRARSALAMSEPVCAIAPSSKAAMRSRTLSPRFLRR